MGRDARGARLPRDESVVTVYGGEPPHNVNDHVSTTAAGILNNVADVAATLGSNVGWYMSPEPAPVVLGPEHAADHRGRRSLRADVQRFVFEHARYSPRAPQARRHVGNARLAGVDAGTPPTTPP